MSNTHTKLSTTPQLCQQNGHFISGCVCVCTPLHALTTRQKYIYVTLQHAADTHTHKISPCQILLIIALCTNIYKWLQYLWYGTTTSAWHIHLYSFINIITWHRPTGKRGNIHQTEWSYHAERGTDNWKLRVEVYNNYEPSLQTVKSEFQSACDAFHNLSTSLLQYKAYCAFME